MIKVIPTKHMEITYWLVDGAGESCAESLLYAIYEKNNLVYYFIPFISCTPNGLMKTKTF